MSKLYTVKIGKGAPMVTRLTDKQVEVMRERGYTVTLYKP